MILSLRHFHSYRKEHERIRETLCVVHLLRRTRAPAVFSERQLREKKKNSESRLSAETDGFSQKHMETLSQICSTHVRYAAQQHVTKVLE